MGSVYGGRELFSRILQQVANDALQFSRDQRIAQKIVGTTVNGLHILGPIPGLRNDNERGGMADGVLNVEQVGVTTVAKKILTDHETEFAGHDVARGKSKTIRQNRGDAAKKENSPREPRILSLSQTTKPLGIARSS